jgi:hypothetical protein
MAFIMYVIIQDSQTGGNTDSQLNLVDAHTHEALQSILHQTALAASIGMMVVVLIEALADIITFSNVVVTWKCPFRAILIRLVGSTVIIISAVINLAYCIPGLHVMVIYFFINYELNL